MTIILLSINFLTYRHNPFFLLILTICCLTDSTFDSDFIIFSRKNIKYKNKAMCPAKWLIKKILVVFGEMRNKMRWVDKWVDKQ